MILRATCRQEGIIDSQLRFAGKTVLITGGGSGLGAAAARQFASEGARLILVDLNLQALETTKENLRETGAAVEVIVGDAASAGVADAAVKTARDAFGGLDVLFNNAGIDPLQARSVVETSEALWDAVMNVNVKSAYLFSRAAIPVMIERGGGAIVNTASVSAVLPSPQETAYSVSKAAMVQLTKCIAIDFAAQKVRANCICPGFLEAVMSDRRQELAAESLQKRSSLAATSVPLGREGRYDEVARSVLFLASDDSSYTTGAALVIDGGITLL